MIIYPAVDLYDSKIVRLYQGEYGKKTEYPFSPTELVKKFISQGAGWVHIVDLEGAEKGHPVHLDVVRQIATMGIKVQMGGGLRAVEDIEAALESGARRVYVGSILAKDSDAAVKLYSRWGNRIIPAVDIKNDRIVVSGWKEIFSGSPYSLLSDLYEIGYRNALVTSVTKDGTFNGPDIALYGAIRKKVPDLDIIAAGGVASVTDIRKLKDIGCAGTVIGKALYDGRFDLSQILEAAR